MGISRINQRQNRDMAFDSKSQLDNIDWQLLSALQEDARLSYAELGRMVSLSSPAVAERVRKLENLGIIAAYRTEVSPEALGYTIQAFVRLTVITAQSYPRLIALGEEIIEIREMHHVAGSDSFVIRVIAKSVGELEATIKLLTPFGETATSIVMSSPVLKKTLSTPD